MTTIYGSLVVELAKGESPYMGLKRALKRMCEYRN